MKSERKSLNFDTQPIKVYFNLQSQAFLRTVINPEENIVIHALVQAVATFLIFYIVLNMLLLYLNHSQ